MEIKLQLFASTYSTQKTEEKTETSSQGGSHSHTVTNNAAGKVDALTQQKFDEYKQGYKPSQSVTDAYNYLQNILNKKPGAFQSEYKDALDKLYDQVTGREKFSYDMNKDMLYQQYKDMYMKSGQKAMQDTLGQAAALTGGFNSSYAQTAAQQTYQEYLGSLNDRVPELYQQAFNRYQQEGDDLYRKFSMANELYGKEYGEYRDQVSDWQTDRDFASGRYESERNFDYNDFANMLEFYQNEYWNQRHSVSESTTDESHWSSGSSTSTSKSESNSGSSSGGGSGSSGGRPSSGGSSKPSSKPSSVSTYAQAVEYLKSKKKDPSKVVTYNEYQTNWSLKNKYGSGPENYVNYLNMMCGF